MELIDSSELKKYILSNFDQVELFSYYLEIPETDINYCLENKNNAISNPLRDDRDPSLGFMASLDTQTNCFKVRMYDWADPNYRGDCFDLVGKLIKLNPRIGTEFIAICNDIVYTMKHKTLHRSTNTVKPSTKQQLFTSIHIEPRLWNGKDISLWDKFGLPFKEYLNIVFPLERSYISNYCNYTYDEKDPGYAWVSGYYDSRTLYTLYFPFRSGKEKNKPRFIKNNKFYPIECIHELKPADILVLTKAFKERLLIKRLLPRITTEHTIQVSNFTSESVVLSDNFVLQLYNIYPLVVTNTDFDYAGLISSRQHKRKYGMMRFVPTNGRYGTYNYGGKDLCEIFDAKGEDYCISLLQESYDYIKYQIELETERLM